jgi:DNA polymerase (family 10)
MEPLGPVRSVTWEVPEMDRKTASKTLREISRLLEVDGDNPHRVRAFAGAARAVERVEGDLEELVATGEIVKARGVGKGTAAVLSELAAGERPRVLVEVEERVPEGVRDMLGLPGLGPKKVRVLWQELGAGSLGELEYACRENRLLDLKGFGPATQSAVLDAIQFKQRSRSRRLLHQAWAEAESCIRALSGASGVGSVRVAGELRRGCDTVGGLDLVVEHGDGCRPGAVARVVGDPRPDGDHRWIVQPADSLPVRLWFTRPGALGTVMLRATGGDQFVDALEARADDAGLPAIDSHVPRIDDPDGSAGERRIFERLELPWVAPELRDDDRWLARAAGGTLIELVNDGDLLGALHNHTSDSDGAAPLEEMAQAAARRDWSFFGVADHSPAAFYANGVTADRLRAQWARADRWMQGNPGTRIVKGLEADILPDGRLDIPPGCEPGLEYVVASVHSSFKLSHRAQTERLVTAVGHPSCRVLGHPTGRLLLAREGYQVDLGRVLDACAEHGVAVEINASPYRLDLDWRWAAEALARGLKLVVNPDAHSVEGLDDVRWGIAVARKAGATRQDLVNCSDIEEFLSD